MLLFIDTETTGRDPKKARLVELAFIVCRVGEDNQPLEVARAATLIRPDEIDQFPSSEAMEVHGITGDEMLEKGSPLSVPLSNLTDLIQWLQEDSGTHRLICHNLNYDFQVLAEEYKRIGKSIIPLSQLSPFCTMQAITDRCRLPGKYGKYKWPRLQEAWEYCFPGLDFRNNPGQAHRAMFDAERCRDIYFHGLQQGWWHCARY